MLCYITLRIPDMSGARVLCHILRFILYLTVDPSNDLHAVTNAGSITAVTIHCGA